MELTHASFFSGVGGMDIGLEKAGWRTVSLSEIEPYACAVLSERWPDVPNLGDIVQLDSRDQVAGHQPSRLTDLADRVGTGHPLDAGGADQSSLGGDDAGTSAGHGHERSEDVRRDGVSPRVGLDRGDTDDLDLRAADDLWRDAVLWSAGFPCQDLSLAGKRAGFDGKRSVLAFTFLDLVERHRPHAFILENVAGLLSSNAGRDFGRLLGEVGELGYWWAYRVLDAQWFGVPQRRRRVFVVAIDSRRYPDPNGPGQVLAIGTRCGRNHSQERSAWAEAAGRTGRGADIARQSISSKWSKQSSGPSGDEHHHLVVDRAPADADRVREADGMAGRLDDREEVEDKVEVAERSRLIADTGVVTALSKSFGGVGPDAAHAQAGWLIVGESGGEDDGLPDGLDTNRYKAIGNGVASPCSEWIGRRLAAWLLSQ